MHDAKQTKPLKDWLARIVVIIVVGVTSVPLFLFEPLRELTKTTYVVIETGTLEAP